MSRIICITEMFDIYDNNGMKTGRKEFLVSHGVCEDILKNIILPCENPSVLGAKFDKELNEWILE